MRKPIAKTSYVYRLLDPRTSEVKYIGVTVNLKRRRVGHYGVYVNRVFRKWVEELSSEGLEPVAEIIESCPTKTRQERELHWINYYNEAGADLVNYDGVRRAYSLDKFA